jgi:hypothetical protein
MITRSFTLDDFAHFFAQEIAGHRVKEAKEVALETVAKMIEAEAKRSIGTYLFDWPQLAEATQADRERKGFPANEPLLRTGALRDSISHQIIEPGKLAEVGSTSEIAVYQEMGTEAIPPRPFLLPSVLYLEKPIKKVVGEIIGSAIAGASIEGEILKLALEAVKKIGEDAKELVESGDADEHARRQH